MSNEKTIAPEARFDDMPNKDKYFRGYRMVTRQLAVAAIALVVLFASFFIYDRYFVNHSCYTFYLEVKDKDKQERILSDEEVKACIDKVCIEYDTGYTLWIGQGGYIGNDNKVHTDDTFILRINNLNKKKANDMALSFIKSVNSTACMIEENRSNAVLKTIY